MKLITFIILAACLHVSAHGYSQVVSLSGKNMSLPAVFSSIEKQTGLSFFFNTALIQDTKPVTVDIKDVPLENALHAILKDEGLDFYKMGKTIFIVKKKEAAVTAAPDPEPPTKQIDVKGRVLNEQGEALPGATVSVKSTKKMALTNERGEFEFKNVSIDAMLQISYLGYQQKEILVETDRIITVRLTMATSKLDGVQVIAYGTTSQRFSIGDVTTVSGADIEKQPVSNPLLALEGRVPGLFLTQNTGLSGSGVIAQIRGLNSISYGNDPFYVVDGVPYTSELLPNLGGVLGFGGVQSKAPGATALGSPLSYINPSDIESISVLKDADATAIYGSRAANGAILITTKKGKAGKMRVDLNMQSGWGKITRKLDILNRQEYLQMRREAFKSDGVTQTITNAPDLLIWDTTRSTDWQKVFIGGTSQYTNFNAGISGGSSSTQYSVGGTYNRQTTVFPGTSADEKAGVHFSLQSVSDNQKFRTQITANYLIDNNRLPPTDLTNKAIVTPPDAPPLYTSDGKLNWAPGSSGAGTWTNPISYLYKIYDSRAYNLISSALLSYQVIPGLDIKTSLGYNSLLIQEYQTNPLIATDPAYWSTTSRTANYVDNSIRSWIIEPQLTYKLNIGKGRLDAIIGSTINQATSNGQQLNGSGYNSDVVLQSIKSAATISVQSNTSAVYKYAAAFGRVNYIWNDKYLANLIFRRDGSSRFGSANQFHDFESAGIGWIFSQEDFIKKTLPFLSFGKLRVSYGTTGNDQIGDYQFMNLYTAPSVQVPYQGIAGLKANGLANPYLQWEETQKMEFGGNLGFLKDRILINASYYRNRTSNELLGYNLPYITGFGNIILNFPAKIQNSGWEFSLNTTNIKSSNFSWSTNFNLSIGKNKLLSFPNIASSSYASTLVVGQPFNIQKVFHLVRVNDTTGIYQFSTTKGQITSTPVTGTDNTTLVNINPVFYGGFQNTFKYYGIELDFLFQFVKQTGHNYLLGNVPGSQLNQPVSVLKRWQKPGDQTTIQRYNSNSSIAGQWLSANSSDAAYSDASFIRLKNISLSWQIPFYWEKKPTSESLSIYLQAQNLITITKYKGMDPENQSTTSLPPLRMITIGMRVGF